MSSRYLRLFGVLFFSFLFIDATYAQRIAECDKNLGKSVESEQTNDAIRISWLYTIDRSRFEDIKRGVQTGANVIVKAIPISGYANYEDFRKDVEEEHTRVQSDYTEERSRAYVRTYFSQTSETGYADCLKTVRSYTGVTLWLKSVTPSVAEIEIKWSPEGQDNPEKIDVQVTGGTKPGNIQEIWQGNVLHNYLFQREPGKDLGVAVNLGNSGDSFLLPVPPVVTSPPRSLVPPQFVGNWTGIRYEMAPDNMGNVTVKYVIDKDGAITIFEYDYGAIRHAKAVVDGDGLSFSQSLEGDKGVTRQATATLAQRGARIADKPPRPNAEACGEPCLDITILNVQGDRIQQEGYLTRR